MRVVTYIVLMSGMTVTTGLAWVLFSLGHGWLALLPLVLALLLLYILAQTLRGVYQAN